MRYALDENGKKTHINQTHVKNDYFCPICNEKLILRKGNLRAHHFSHMADTFCNDNWNYDMSEWHLEWQERFPTENREIVLENNGEKHRADVLINNTVIEFQHSSLSSYEFDRRNEFYLSLGYNVTWIFDVADLYDTGAISLLDNSETKYKWRRPYKTFENFNPKNKKIELYFQLSYEDEEFLKDFEESSINLIKIDWIAPSGMERFVSNRIYGPEHILDRFMHKESVKKENSLGDSILNVWRKINPRSVIILENIRTGYFVKIAKRQKTMLENTGKCYGYLSRDQYKYPENESEIYYFNQPEWICVWHK